MQNNFRLTAAATVPLPRVILIALCISYTLAGLFFRDPWKGEDIVGFSIMHTLSSSPWKSWLTPFQHIVPESGPLIFWLGAMSIKWTKNLLGELNASRLPVAILFFATCKVIWKSTYLLGKRHETQPFRYAFGGEPSRKDYGRTIADGALLILLACFGLTEKSHQTTAVVTQIFSISIIIFAMVNLSEKLLRGLFLFPIGIAFLSLSTNYTIALSITVLSLGICVFHPHFRHNRLALLLYTVPLSIFAICIWPLAIYLLYPSQLNIFYTIWVNTSKNYFNNPSTQVLLFTLKNLPLFAWPAWPLAIYGFYKWKKNYFYLHVIIPLTITLPILTITLLRNYPDNQIFALLLPGLSILAAFALPTLSQAIINAIDWFNILTFTPTAIFIWLVWSASLIGIPNFLEKNINRLVPGLEHSFGITSFIIALASTIIWILAIYWRATRSPQMIWRSAALSAAGTSLIWILLMTLWLPLINYSRSYRMVCKTLHTKLSKNYKCIQPIDLGKAQQAAFSYFGKISFNELPGKCNWILRQDERNKFDPYFLNKEEWLLIWEGNRSTDRRERFRLYKYKTKTFNSKHR